MNGFADALFGPLPRSYCAYFYILSIIGLLAVLISLFGLGKLMMDKSSDRKSYMAATIGALTYGIIYFQNRILHGMCVHSLA
jgi:hypothetical protein